MANPVENKVNENIGVMVGRFQVHKLTDAHLDLLTYLVENHKHVLIVLGVSPIIPSMNDPLTFSARKQMLEEALPPHNVDILPLHDTQSDQVWSENLDKLIRGVHVHGDVRLYGGRDSFIKSYTTKKFPTTELESKAMYDSGTQIRSEVSRQLRNDESFRAGVIYGTTNRFPTVYSTIDVAVVNDAGEILLGRKPEEDKFRFFGGFVDPRDTSLIHAGRREVSEEASITPEDFKYITSVPIDDWRYRAIKDKIMTHLFTARYVMGSPRPSDDIAEVRWFKLSELKDNPASILMPEHLKLWDELDGRIPYSFKPENDDAFDLLDSLMGGALTKELGWEPKGQE